MDPSGQSRIAEIQPEGLVDMLLNLLPEWEPREFGADATQENFKNDSSRGEQGLP
jgi:hypothetical protein